MSSVKQPVGPDPTALQDLRWVGKSVPRKEDPKLLTGRAQYVGDVTVTGMLHGAVLRSPHANARIRSIDTSRAKALPGVVAVLTGADAAELIEPMTAFCAEPVPQHAIAVERVRFPGEAVAAVAATSRYIAEDACALIDVDYEVLPAIVDPVAAMDAEAPLVHDTLDSNVVFAAHDRLRRRRAPTSPRADHVIRRTARWHRMGAQPMETAGTVASWDPFAQSMTLWSNTNFYNFLPWTFANMLRVPSNRLKVIPCTVGGSFGSKHLINKVIAIAGVLTKATGRPVKFMEDRVDNLAANDNVGPDRLYDAALAVTGDGEFLSLKLDIVDDYGAYFQFAHGQHGNALSQPTGPYRIGSLRYGIQCVLTNKVQQGFFRGAGADPGNLILERLVDADRRRARDRARRDPAAELHPARAVPVQGPDRQHVRQRRLRGRARHARSSWPTSTAGAPSRRRRARRAATSASAWRAARSARATTRPSGGSSTTSRRCPRRSTPESVKIDVSAFGQVRVELGCPLWGNSPETVVSQVVAEEFGIEPVRRRRRPTATRPRARSRPARAAAA